MSDRKDPVAELCRLWQLGQAPALGQFLVGVDEMAPSELAAVLWVDQHERWRIGQRIPAEKYLRSYPKLASDQEIALELIYGEFLLREQLGDKPSLGEYGRRFPHFAARLEEQIEVGRAMRALGSGTRSMDSSAAPTTARPQWESTLRMGVVDGNRPQIPGYQIVSELGAGGMGVVYKARDLRLDRLVALKMMARGSVIGGEELVRFQREAAAVARLQHPNIVQIHEVGEHQGRPYLTLEFVEGGNLAQHTGRQPQPAAWSAALVEALARAIHHAHERGIIHRDVKPANVLLEIADCRLQNHTADSQSAITNLQSAIPKLTDFGVAKWLDGQSALTESDAILGTPSYMAPEQANGKSKETGPAADVYALGAVLYELLTGRPPFLGESHLATLQQVATQEPVSARRLQPGVPRDLDTICLKCLHKEPRGRYATAAALADDLGRYRTGRPILARPAGPCQRLWRWCRRNSLAASLLAAIALLIVGSLAGLTALWRQAESARANAESNFDLAECSRARAETNFRLALQVVDNFCTKVGESEELKLHDLEQLRHQLLQSAKDFFERFVEEPGGGPDLEAERGRAYWRLGDLTSLIDSKAKAIDWYQKALDIQSRLVRDHAEVVAFQMDLARTQSHLGGVYQETGKCAAAEQAYQSAVDILLPLSAVGDPAPEVLHDLAETYNDVAKLHVTMADKKKAELALLAGADMRRSLLARYPSNAGYQHDVVVTMTNLGSLYFNDKKLAKAEYAWQEALAAAERNAQEHSKTPEYQRDLARCQNHLAVIFITNKEMKKAENAWELALGIQKDLVSKHPRISGYWSDLAATYNNLGFIYQRTDRSAEAKDAFKEATKLFENLLASQPDDMDLACKLAGACINTAKLAKLTNDASVSQQAFERAGKLLQGVLARDANYARATQLLKFVQ